MKLRWVAVLAAIVAAGFARPTHASDGFVGIYADPEGTNPCLTIPPSAAPVTVFVLARLDGQTAGGIAGVEFRIDGLPTSWSAVFAADPGVTVQLGDPFGIGVNMAWATCQTGVGGIVRLGTAAITAPTVESGELRIVHRTPPTNPSFPCAHFNICDSPNFTKICNRVCATDSVVGDIAFRAPFNSPSCRGDPCAGGVPDLPPDCSAAAPTRSSLWPPDKNLVEIGIVGVTDPDGDTVTIAIVGVESDEPVGKTCPDAVIAGETVQLRAESQGGGNGRVYTVHFTATDPAGLSCAGSVAVCVPAKSRKSGCTDDGGSFNSSACDSSVASKSGGGGLESITTRDEPEGVVVVFRQPATGRATLAVYDLRGRLVRQLVDGMHMAGEHTVLWDGRDAGGHTVARGVYLVRAVTAGVAQSSKIVWLR